MQANKVGKIFLINSELMSIRLWKTWYLTLWFHKPVAFLSRISINKVQFCGTPFYLDDKNYKKILGLAINDLEMILDVNELMTRGVDES